MLWSSFHHDNMDAKEQADRMAAAEALYMISTRVDKSGPLQKIPRRGRKKKNNDYTEDITAKKKNGIDSKGDITVNSYGRRGSKKGTHRGRGTGGSRAGRNGRGGRSSPRSRGETGKQSGFFKGQQRLSADDDCNEDFIQRNNSNYQAKRGLSGGEKIEKFDEYSKATSKSRTVTAKSRNQRTKSSSPSGISAYSHVSEVDDKPHQALGFTGATLSINDLSNKRGFYDSAMNLQSLSLASSFRQVSLTSQSLPSVAPIYSLPSINLMSYPDVNLPSLPLEIASLQLSSQPVPNLSSLRDLAVGVMEDDRTSSGRHKSEKSLPLKKRKLHNPSEAEVQEPAPSMEAASSSSSEGDQSEPGSPTMPTAEPVRASYTVQAPPIITYQTLMEIKTALSADDDGDLPLHIAVVHENMRMVMKLIALMKIAGKGVDKFNKQQQTPLHLAVKLNFLEAVDVLLKYGADVNAVDFTGSSSVHMAIQGRSKACLALLLERCPNADLNVRNFDGLTPLHIAVDNGDLEQVELLLKYNTDIDVTDGKSGRTALFRAAESNHKSMVELLLGKGANPDVPNYAGVTTVMAAQGRNLHGVLKLLGSVVNDKFTEYETKPSGLTIETKSNALYLGFPSSYKLASSPHNPAKGDNLSKRPSPDVIDPKCSTAEMAETPPNETKVFHNIFVLAQDKEKNVKTRSSSEPASPEVKMEVTECKDEEISSGLLLLPEGISSRSREEEGNSQLVQRSGASAGGQGCSITSSQEKPQGAAFFYKPSPTTLAGDQRSITPRALNPASASSALSTVIGALSSSLNSVSPTSFESSAPSSKPASSVASTLVPQSVPLASLPTSTHDAVTLTGMQARLFQMLLKMYNIDPANEESPESGDGQKTSCPAPSPSPQTKLSSSPSPVVVTTTSTASLSLKPALMKIQTPLSSKDTGEFIIVKKQQSTEDSGSSHSIASSQCSVAEIPSSNMDFSSSDNTRLKAEESPLNLSTSSNRQGNNQPAVLGNVQLSLSKPHPVSGSVLSTSALKDTGYISSIKPRLSPVQFGSKGKVISFGVHRISDADKGGNGNTEGAGHVEVYIMPSSEQSQGSAVIQLGPSGPVSGSNSSKVAGSASIFQEKITGKQILEQRPAGEVTHVADFHTTATSISQKTASIVRDYLTQQNQILLQRHNSSPLLSSKAPTSLSSNPAQVPTVLDSAAENAGSKNQVIALARSPSNVVTIGKAASNSNPSSSNTLLFPVLPSSPIFLHQGQVIDLSKSKVSNHSNTSISHIPAAFSNTDTSAGQGKIIGFSGAILSVVPPKTGEVNKQSPKKVQRRRGRKKSQIFVHGSTAVPEIGVGKINSETDEKLKKFLGAKKQDISLFLQNEQVSDGDEAGGDTSGSGISEVQMDKTYTTVGIFSGDVQHVKFGKHQPLRLTSHTVTPSSISQLPLVAVHSLLASQTTVLKSEGNASNADSMTSLFPSSSPLVAVTINAAEKSCDKQPFLESVKESPNIFEKTGNSERIGSLATKSALPSEQKASCVSPTDNPAVPEKHKRLKKAMFPIIDSKEGLVVINKKVKNSYPGSQGKDLDSDVSAGCRNENQESGKAKKMSPPKKNETRGDVSAKNDHQKQKGKGVTKLSPDTKKGTKKTQSKTSTERNGLSSDSEQVRKQSRRRRNKLELQEKELVSESRTTSESDYIPPVPTTRPASTNNLIPRNTRSANTETAMVASPRGNRRDVSSMEAHDDDDDQPALVIEELEMD